MKVPTLTLLFLSLLIVAACTRAGNAVRLPRPAPSIDGLDRQAHCRATAAEAGGFGASFWSETDFCRHSVPYESFLALRGRDRIPPIDSLRFETTEEATLWLTDREPLLLFEHDDDVRGYPLLILMWHEIVNDMVGGRPVAVTYCPLCNAGLAFERTLEGQVLDFGTTGNVHKADLVMYDRETQSWWQQFTGEAIVGRHTGRRLKPLPVRMVSFADFKTHFPNGRILSIDTGFNRPYGENPYINYDVVTNPRTKFFKGETDKRLPPKRRVLGVQIGTTTKAYPFDVLEAEQVANDTVNEEPLAVFWKPGALSPLDAPILVDSKAVGSATAFSRRVDGKVLSFVPAGDDETFLDEQTGSRWNILGQAVSGPLTGEQLHGVTSQEFFWFAWAAFEPETGIYHSTR